jgi:hypothetical protein
MQHTNNKELNWIIIFFFFLSFFPPQYWDTRLWCYWPNLNSEKMELLQNDNKVISEYDGCKNKPRV